LRLTPTFNFMGMVLVLLALEREGVEMGFASPEPILTPRLR